MKTDRTAFTLIELLVVIAIIGVLTGLLLPVLGSMQEKGRSAKCTSNLKQIGAAMLAFAGEHNGLCPLSGGIIEYHMKDPNTGQFGWTEQLEPYTGTDRRLYICPSSSRVLPTNAQYSYFQGARAATVAANGAVASLRLVMLASPSKCILAGDIGIDSIFTATDDDKDDYTNNPAFARSPVPFHGGRANLVFADGHCAAFEAFDANAMNTHYSPQADGTGYGY